MVEKKQLKASLSIFCAYVNAMTTYTRWVRFDISSIQRTDKSIYLANESIFEANCSSLQRSTCSSLTISDATHTKQEDVIDMAPQKYLQLLHRHMEKWGGLLSLYTDYVYMAI